MRSFLLLLFLLNLLPLTSSYLPTFRHLLSSPSSTTKISNSPNSFNSQTQIIDDLNTEQKIISENNYKLRSKYLLSTTSIITISLSSLAYITFDNPYIPLSYLAGGLLGLFYLRGLSSYVSTVGASDITTDTLKDAGSGAGRFAGFLMLFVLARAVGDFNLGAGVAGFFTYQVGSVVEGFRSWND